MILYYLQEFQYGKETERVIPKLKLYKDNTDRIRSPIVGTRVCKSRKLFVI